MKVVGLAKQMIIYLPRSTVDIYQVVKYVNSMVILPCLAHSQPYLMGGKPQSRASHTSGPPMSPHVPWAKSSQGRKALHASIAIIFVEKLQGSM